MYIHLVNTYMKDMDEPSYTYHAECAKIKTKYIDMLKDHIDRIGKVFYTKKSENLYMGKKCSPATRRGVTVNTENQDIRWKQHFGNLDQAKKTQFCTTGQ